MDDDRRGAHCESDSYPNKNFKPNTSANINRARQFMPFAALKGYYDLVGEAERIKEPKRDLSEEALDCLYAKLFQVEKGDMVQVTYYDADVYVGVKGPVTNVDTIFSKLTIAKTTILFENILEIEGVGTN